MINLTKKFRQDGPAPEVILLPLLPLRDIVVFPYMVAPLFVGRSKSVKALADAMNNEKNVFLATQKKIGEENPDINDISLIGTIGKVLQLLRLPDGTVKALVEGKSRARIRRFVHQEDFFQVEIEPITEDFAEDAECQALGRAIVTAFREYADLAKNISKE
ncbi:MAG: LON peptidase substrate-binding domain-containing protein, partial [Deltaproteobacteria bacterium]|nr:LON peptidase substrate-binding domain-containing protein [Deltaproteobacteria bacterium]